MANLKAKRTLTEKKVAGMLLENTGTHFMDSGGACGRHWQHNQGREFARENAVSLSGHHGYIDFTVNLFHFLVEKLTYDPTMQRRLNAFARRADQREESWYPVMDNFVEYLKEKAEQDGMPFGGIYGEGDPVSVNSYNSQNNLSQTIQFIYWEDNDGDHVLLQIHGGADVRGGYTAPKAFTCNSELSIFDYQRGTIRCTGDTHNDVQAEIPGMETEKCEAYWDTDDAYHWYPEGTCGQGYVQLETYEMVQESEEDSTDEEEEHGWRKGILYVKEDGTMLCPHCGSTLGGSIF